MAEFVYFYRGYEPPASPGEMQKKTAKWMAWLKDLSDKGHVKSLGDPLQPVGKVVKGKKSRSLTAPMPKLKTWSEVIVSLWPRISNRLWSFPWDALFSRMAVL
jgi:hypothetical protein